MDVDALLPGDDPGPEAYRAHIRELEARLEESEETLAAIRRGDFDAVVVEGPNHERLVYTLENADRPYRVLIEQIQEGAFTLGLDGTLLYCNRRLADMLGEPQERLLGRSLRDFVLGDTDLDRLVRTAMTSPVRGEVELRAAAGTESATFLSLSRFERQDDEPLLCGILTDLTEQRRNMQALAEAHARLQSESVEREQVEEALRQSQKLEAVGQLTGGVAHDFNNLLTVIKSSTDLLKRSDLPEARRQRYIAAISDTVDRAAKLTGQLLAFARRQALRPEVIEVGASLRAVAEMLDSVTGARITVDARIPEEPCYIRADLSQFETALINMAVNARDAMGGEGTLTLNLKGGRPMPAIRGHAGSRSTFAAVSLSDTGIGISPEVLPRIFEPFFTTKDIGKGTGLGLSQVFGFAKQSGGDVDVSSTPGEGTTFVLYLPQVEAAPEAADANPREDRGLDVESLCVLVVEDNVEVGRFATQILEDLGHQTVWVTNAEEALLEIEKIPFRFDAVFSDVVMPGMGGIELARALQRRVPDLPVVLTSGYSHVLAEEGAHGFNLIQKPYSVEQLSRVLRQVAGQQRLAGRGIRQ
ncbi:PAS domain-containing hybrid sensor histidine kinase/response regulator [Methylobacterium sp. J-070]|uniref:PAS domain-containing hybrid sensor histidine kinase/response regulator n=1 Tax=Methylobacterium sp. J-070 TaxID=2836650 RepID=UPI001FBB1BDB|nr:PAS domain-containing hybrid sensor histidine kinase/response regulator [Methylobacterium sp. J-070]MCJ2052386.1 ATP-binding protein [Methylobacterium sp. J-070]